MTIAGLLAVVGCSSGGQATPEVDDDGPAIIQPTPTPAEDQPELEVTELQEDEVGVLVNRFDLDPGDCFNTYDAGLDPDIQPTTRVIDCSEPHESEVYYQRNYPAGAEEGYPGDEAMRRWTEQRCYREFGGFTGSTYELSQLEIGEIHPTEETWTGPGLHREITCYVYAVGGGGLRGSMAQSGF